VLAFFSFSREQPGGFKMKGTISNEQIFVPKKIKATPMNTLSKSYDIEIKDRGQLTCHYYLRFYTVGISLERTITKSYLRVVLIID
jgi:hypothetical protein